MVRSISYRASKFVIPTKFRMDVEKNVRKPRSAPLLIVQDFHGIDT
jgi:hypothetical protein